MFNEPPTVIKADSNENVNEELSPCKEALGEIRGEGSMGEANHTASNNKGYVSCCWETKLN